MNIVNLIAYLVTGLSIIVVPICIIIGIVVGVSGPKTADEVARKRRKKLAYNIALYPIVVTVIVIVIWGLIKIVTNG